MDKNPPARQLPVVQEPGKRDGIDSLRDSLKMVLRRRTLRRTNRTSAAKPSRTAAAIPTIIFSISGNAIGPASKETGWVVNSDASATPVSKKLLMRWTVAACCILQVSVE